MSYTPSLEIEGLVSVIVRTKDRTQMLREAIASIVDQRHRPIEVVLINDGGEDVFTMVNTLLQSTDDISLKYITNKTSAGRSGAANAGLNAASGKFSLFLDDDDLLESEHISDLLIAHQKAFRADELGATHSVAKAMLIDEGSQKFLSTQGQAFTPEQLLYQNCLPIMTVLFNTRLRDFAQFSREFDLFEDWDFWLQVSQHCSFHFVDACHCIYRMHDNASSVRAEQTALKAYEQIYLKWLPHQSAETLSKMLCRSHHLHSQMVAQLQSNNQAELDRIGALHQHALSVIQQKDLDLEKLESEYQHAIKTIGQKDRDIEKLSVLQQQALDVIAKKDEDVAHLSTLHKDALETISQKDRDASNLANLYNDAVDYIAKLEEALSKERPELDELRSQFSSLQTHLQQLELDNQHKKELLLKPWYWHLYQGLKHKKH